MLPGLPRRRSAVAVRVAALIGPLTVAVALAGCSGSGDLATVPTSAPTMQVVVPPGGVGVSGANLVNDKGQIVQLRGVNRPGLEYSCSQSNKFMADGYHGQTPDGTNIAYADTVASSLLSWDKPGATGHAINTVRLPLNEECWLGINGAPAAYSGANYQAFVKRLVDNLTAQHINVVLTLHWSAPGTWLPGKDATGTAANGQNLAPNAEHSIPFWQQVANQYKTYGNVVFDLFNEPGISCRAGNGCPTNIVNGGYFAQDDWAWNLYRDGGSYTYTTGDGDMYATRAGQTFQIAGTQQLVNTIRATGSTNVITIETLGWGNGYIDMMGTHMPNDPAGQLMASIHTYDFSGYNPGTTTGQTNLDSVLATALRRDGTKVRNVRGIYPLFLGEFGVTARCPNGVDRGAVTATLDWADRRGDSYAAWGWDEGEGCDGPSLVTSNDAGTATPFGAVVKAHLQARQR